MFCRNCGEQLQEGQRFCSKCGTKAESILATNAMNEKKDVEAVDRPEHELKNSGADEAQNDVTQKHTDSLINRIVLKFDNVLTIIEAVCFFVMGYILFSVSGFFGKAFGVLLIVGSLIALGCGVKRLFSHSWGKNISEKDLRKKKGNLFLCILVLILVIVIIVKTGGGTYLLVREVSFDSYGSETIGEIIEENIKDPKWSQKKLDSDTKRVFVEGYSPLYDEDIKISFYVEKVDEGYEVTLQSISFLESEELYSGSLNASMIWSSFYN